MIKYYNKLIRDNIPEICKNNGEICKTRELDLPEFAFELSKKLDEEITEFHKAFDSEDDEQAVKELADVVEVAYAILDLIGVDHNAFEKLREAKKIKNGGFDKRLFLEYVNDGKEQ